MKKFLLILLVLFLMASCSLEIRNEEGFRLFAYQQFIYEENVCVQSHSSFFVDGEEWKEYVGSKPLIVTNLGNSPIVVKVTNIEQSYYMTIVNASSVIIE